MNTIKTIPALRAAIRKAKVVLFQARFGCSEKWVKVSKKEALDFAAGFDDVDTPDSLEMGVDYFASWHDDDYLFVG